MKTNFKILDLQEAQIEYLSDNIASSIGGGIGRTERQEAMRELRSCIKDLIEEVRAGNIVDYTEQRADCIEDYMREIG